MEASVLVPNLNGERFLEPYLTALVQQTLAVSQVIVIDSGSTDGSVELVRQRFPEARLEVPANSFATTVAVDKQEFDRAPVEALDDGVARRGLLRIGGEEVERLPRTPVAADGTQLVVRVPAAEQPARQVDADERRVLGRDVAERVEGSAAVGADLDHSRRRPRP